MFKEDIYSQVSRIASDNNMSVSEVLLSCIKSEREERANNSKYLNRCFIHDGDEYVKVFAIDPQFPDSFACMCFYDEGYVDESNYFSDDYDFEGIFVANYNLSHFHSGEMKEISQAEYRQKLLEFINDLCSITWK